MSDDAADRLQRLVAELESLHLRLVDLLMDLEAERAVRTGTLAQPSPETPTQITHDVPPDAPR